ncbi:MAG: GNAT family N-acetyltransferase [Desulfobacterales bacterium]|jgi:GNAT superfamily N-acetyltransferase
MIIRSTAPEDFEAVANLIRQLMPGSSWDSGMLKPIFETALASPDQVYVSALRGRAVAGFASMTVRTCLWNAGPIAFIDELVVDESHRGAGIGSRLLDRLAEEASERGCRYLELDSAPHRESAHRFYRDRGFECRALLFSRPLAASAVYRSGPGGFGEMTSSQ